MKTIHVFGDSHASSIHSHWGYIRIPNMSVGNPTPTVAQCTMCESQGEVSYEDHSLYGAISIPGKLQ